MATATPQDDTLSPRQLRFVAELLTRPTIAAAAAAAGASARSGYAWWSRPDVRAAYKAALAARDAAPRTTHTHEAS